MTKEELAKIKNILPYRYVKELIRRTGKPISESLVIAVMNNIRADYYGIIDTAIKWVHEIEEEKQTQTNKIKKL